ncbi:hypothetical protein C4J81_05995 [Deltaproteobacteria bacterium Smac51]|nr:hypothetical protein C4J81_05995 [Deltaproteobacteria bacterium Smac51]
MSINSPSFSFLNFLKKLSIGYVYFLFILVLVIGCHFYIFKSFEPSDNIWLVIRCFLLPELIFYRETLYAITSDPFNLLAIQLAIFPYYVAWALYAKASSGQHIQRYFDSYNYRSVFISKFGGTMALFGGLIFIFGIISFIGTRALFFRAIKFGILNIISLIAQKIAVKSKNSQLIKVAVILTFVVNSLTLIWLLSDIVDEISWRFNF